MAKSKSHNVRNSSGRFVSKKTLKQRLYALWCDFCGKLEEINPKHVGLVLLAAAVVWLVFAK